VFSRAVEDVQDAQIAVGSVDIGSASTSQRCGLECGRMSSGLYSRYNCSDLYGV